MTIHEDDVSLPNKKDGKRLYVRHPGGSGVLAITADNQVILVEQYRYAIGKNLLEIPAGKHEINDDALATAKKELAEETGYTADHFEWLYDFYPTPGYSDEIISIFLAKNAYPLQTKVKPDDDEFITIRVFSKNDIEALLEENTIHDSKTLIALNYFIHMR